MQFTVLEKLILELLFTFSGLTIDTTAANLASNNQLSSIPELRSLGTRQRRQLWSVKNHDYGFHSERNKWLRMAFDMSREPITLPTNASNSSNRTRSERQVPNEILYFHILDKIFWRIFFQIHNKKQQDVNHMQLTTILEETVMEDASVPEHVAQEIIINGRNITFISAGPYIGYLQGPL